MEIQLPQIIFQMINFGVVLAALTYLLYKPIQKILDERAEKVAEGQQAAEESIKARAQLAELEKKTKQEAKKEAQDILEEARKAATTSQSVALVSAKTQAEAEIAKLKEEWLKEKQQLIAEMKAEFVEAVVATAEKVIGENLDTKKHDRLIQDEMNTFLKSL